MILSAAALSALLAAAAPAGPAFAADKAGATDKPQRVYKVDSVIATVKGKTLTIQAGGAVNSGGWKQARLRLVHNDGHVLTLELQAVPPPPGMTVISVQVPVKAAFETRFRPGLAQVTVQATANEVTSQILP